jgi:hypothetical protein
MAMGLVVVGPVVQMSMLLLGSSWDLLRARTCSIAHSSLLNCRSGVPDTLHGILCKVCSQHLCQLQALRWSKSSLHSGLHSTNCSHRLCLCQALQGSKHTRWSYGGQRLGWCFCLFCFCSLQSTQPALDRVLHMPQQTAATGLYRWVVFHGRFLIGASSSRG